MTSATERLRALLDERGVEWEDCGNGATYVEHNGEAWRFDYDEPFDQLGIVCLSGYTPEQAVAATLGPGTCREVKIDRYWRGCGECGYVWEFMYSIGKCERPRYCQNCGRNVVE